MVFLVSYYSGVIVLSQFDGTVRMRVMQVESFSVFIWTLFFPSLCENTRISVTKQPLVFNFHFVACSVLKLLNKLCALCSWMLRIQYLSNDYLYVWITASCLFTSPHANVSLPLRWQQFPFDMQMFWLEEFRSFSVALKLLHYRGRICGMPSSSGFRIQQKSVIRGCCGRIHKWVRMAFLGDSQLSSWMAK